MKKLIFVSLLLVAAITFSCKKDYLIDGGLSNARVDMTTLDYLKSRPHHQFDSLLILLKDAGMEQEVNASITFVAPTNYDFVNFCVQKQNALRLINEDENYVYNFDSLRKEVSLYKDTLRMYMIPGKINRENLTKPVVSQSASGVTVALSLIESKLYTEWVPNSKPMFVWFSKVVNGLDDPNATDIPVTDQDQRSRCQSSGIITNTGIVHILDDDHVFGFRKKIVY